MTEMIITESRVHAHVDAIASRAVVFPDRIGPATIWFEGDTIARIEEDRVDTRARDFGSDYLLPGLVELHTDHLEPHYSPRPKVLWDPEASVISYDAQIAASGITTVFDSLRCGFDIDAASSDTGLFVLQGAIDRAREAGMLRAQHFTHLRCEICSDSVVADAERFLAEHRVGLISLMDHTPGARQFRDEAKLRDYYRGKSNKTDNELDAFFAHRRELYDRNHDRHRDNLLKLAAMHGVRLASHDDTTPDHVAESLACGIGLAEFPTTFEAAAACRDAGIAVMMGAPNVVRGRSHSGNVAARELAEAGLLDILSSDYVPSSLLHGAFLLRDVPAVGGLSGAIRLVSSAPADAVGLHDRGRIATGMRADLLRVSLPGRVPVVREVYCGGERVA